MAASSLFEEDEVCHVAPDKTFIYGLVLETAETVSSDEDDDSQRDVCKKGCVRVAWHPKGRESVDIPENKVLLVDRAFRPGDAVRQLVAGRNTQCGTVQDLDVLCHLHITGTDKYIYGVSSKNLSPCIPVHRYEECYVSLDNWLGDIEEITNMVTLLLPDGARCQVDEKDICSLEDITEKRSETSIFFEEYWYPGQQVKGVLNDLSSVTWLNPTLLYNARNVQTKKNSTFYATVEKVETQVICVHWICRGHSKVGSGSENSMQPPPQEVRGNDIQRLQLVDWFEHCNVKLGDKMFYTIQESDVIETQQPKHRFVPFAAQDVTSERLSEITYCTEELLRSFDGKNGRLPKRKGSKKGIDATSSQTLTSENVSVIEVKLVVNATISDSQITRGPISGSFQSCAKTSVSTSAVNVGCRDIEGDADDEYEDMDDDNKGYGKGDDAKSEEESDAGSNSSALSASGMKRRKCNKQVSMPTKSRRNVSRHKAKRRRPVPEIQLTPGTRVATEVCYTFTWVNVMWQDGTMEERVPSVKLFPLNHLDELEFFPGFFVVDSKVEDSCNEYGVVMSCDHFERTCQVKWLKPYEVGHGTFPSEVIKATEVSVYDIKEHPDYRFRPGHSVIRVAGFEDVDQTLQAVGQVIKLNADGTITVKWTDNSTTTSYPQDLYIVDDIGDYSDSSWGIAESSEDDESDVSWETEEEEEQKEDGEDSMAESQFLGTAWVKVGHTYAYKKSRLQPAGEIREDNDLSSLKNLSEEKRKKIQELLSQGQTHFIELHALCSAQIARASSNSSVTSEISTALHHQFMHDIVRLYRSCRRLDHMLKTSYFCGPEVKGLLAAVKSEFKKEKSKKIKETLEQMFEACNKGLLEGNKEVTAEGAAESEPEAASKQGAENKGDFAISMGNSTDIDMAEVGTEESRDKTAFPLVASSMVTEYVVESRPNVVDSNSKDGDAVAGGGAAMMQSEDAAFLTSVAFVEAQGAQDEEKHISSMLAAAVVNEVSSVDHAYCNIKQDATGDNGLPVASSGGDEMALRSESETVLNIVQICMNLCRSIQTLLDTIHNTLDTVESSYDGTLNTDVDEAQEKDVRSPEACPVVSEQNGTENEQESQKMCSDSLDLDEVISIESSASTIAAGDSDMKEIGFEMVSETPSTHVFISNSCQPTNPRTFNCAVKKELKLLKTSLPPGILVKAYEDRMDLFSVLIDGPAGTPYEDGVFLFDVMLPQDYPASPPLFHYHSFCQDRLNPNLYPDGKVCVSLLGTWSGKGMEVWTEASSLLQVLISIQGLILVDEPYYNEAGYEKQRGQQIANENSRLYNEMAILKFVQSLTTMTKGVSEPFTREVQERLKSRGPRISERLHWWMTLSENMGDARSILNNGVVNGLPSDVPHNKSLDNAAAAGFEGDDTAPGVQCLPVWKHKATPRHPSFPLLPMSKGFRLTLQKFLLEFDLSSARLLSQDLEFKTQGSYEIEDQVSITSSPTAS